MISVQFGAVRCDDQMVNSLARQESVRVTFASSIVCKRSTLFLALFSWLSTVHFCFISPLLSAALLVVLLRYRSFFFGCFILLDVVVVIVRFVPIIWSNFLTPPPSSNAHTSPTNTSVRIFTVHYYLQPTNMLYATGYNSSFASSYGKSTDLLAAHPDPMATSTLSSIHPIESESRQRRARHSLFGLFSENSMTVKIFGHDDKRKIFRTRTNASNGSSIHLVPDVGEIDYRLPRKALVRYGQTVWRPGGLTSDFN
jgi:hypothetical protein